MVPGYLSSHQCSMKLIQEIYVFQYEDFEVLSQTAREVWLAEQCSAFETQIQTLSRERDKDHFLEELYRKLKQVTRRWQSWNHRSFGGVTSRGCVCSCCTFKLNFYRIELFI